MVVVVNERWRGRLAALPHWRESWKKRKGKGFGERMYVVSNDFGDLLWRKVESEVCWRFASRREERKKISKLTSRRGTLLFKKNRGYPRMAQKFGK